MNRDASIETVARVARSLSWLQKLFLGFVLLGISFALFIINSGPTSGPTLEMVLMPVGLLSAGASFMMLVFSYRCARGSGRSGVLWVLAVIFFKIIGLIILCYLTRKWLEKQGVKMHSLGLRYTLPTEDPISDESPGFSRF